MFGFHLCEGRAGVRAGLVLVVAVSMSMFGVLGAQAAPTMCKARDVTTKSAPRSHLQEVIDSAAPGDTVVVGGMCVGNFVISNGLTLVGQATSKYPQATLAGEVSGAYVVDLTGDDTAKVTLTDLTITGAQTFSGSGIRNAFGTVNLTGATLVTGNHALQGGGGIYNQSGVVHLEDFAAVTDNTAYEGGGIYNGGLLVTLSGHASVSDNSVSSGGSGGGIYNVGRVVLNDDAIVSGNVATRGGGIYGHGYPAELHDSASVSSNSAELGGGVYLKGANASSTLTLTGAATIRDNTAARWGGGILAYRGQVALNNHSSLTDNVARLGGGIYVRKGVLTLNDFALVTRNVAESGGGVFNYAGTVFMNDQASVVDNQVDDCVGC